MEYVTLYNGVKVPALGIGTFMISPEDTEKAVYAALKGGYRMIDTANAYMNEEAVGKALARAFSEGIVTRGLRRSLCLLNSRKSITRAARRSFSASTPRWAL